MNKSMSCFALLAMGVGIAVPALASTSSWQLPTANTIHNFQTQLAVSGQCMRTTKYCYARKKVCANRRVCGAPVRPCYRCRYPGVYRGGCYVRHECRYVCQQWRTRCIEWKN